MEVRSLTKDERRRLDWLERKITSTQKQLEAMFDRRAELWSELLGDGVQVTALAEQSGKTRRAVHEAIERRVGT